MPMWLLWASFGYAVTSLAFDLLKVAYRAGRGDYEKREK